MIKVVEAFSGIGSQAKALSKLKKECKIDYKILNTIEWDINAILAYDIIHNGGSVYKKYQDMEREQLLEKISKYPLSIDGKTLANPKYFNRFDNNILGRFLTAIERTNNLVSITDVKAEDLPSEIDILTYSFPCQDLSLSGYFHGDTGGISRDAENSSSMLWQVERILKEMKKINKPLPKALIMENVTNIRSKAHIDNFNDWINSLKKLGYESQPFDLKASSFGIPQTRTRTFMISILHNGDEHIKNKVRILLDKSDLNQKEKNKNKIYVHEEYKLPNILKLDYSNPTYKLEAIEQIPNKTDSREKIKENNPKIADAKGNILIENMVVRTLTTKQDRHPNTGVILVDLKEFGLNKNEKSDFRYLTPRESFLLMGFEEKDFEALINNNFKSFGKYNFFSTNKLIKLAGNSIVVDVIKEVFRETIDIMKKCELI